MSRRIRKEEAEALLLAAAQIEMEASGRKKFTSRQINDLLHKAGAKINRSARRALGHRGPGLGRQAATHKEVPGSRTRP